MFMVILLYDFPPMTRFMSSSALTSVAAPTVKLFEICSSIIVQQNGIDGCDNNKALG